MTTPATAADRADVQPAPTRENPAPTLDAQGNPFGDGRSPFGSATPDFSGARGDAYGPGSSAAREASGAVGSGARPESFGPGSSGGPSETQDQRWANLGLNDLELSDQCGLRETLQRKGIDVDSALRDGSLQPRLEGVFYRDLAQSTNETGRQSFANFIEEHGAKSDTPESKTIGQMWSELGKTRPELSPNATPGEIAAVLAGDVEAISMQVEPALRSMTPEQREENLRQRGLASHPHDVEALLRIGVSARVLRMIDCLN